MSDPSKQARIEDVLRKSLLGEELVNTQFHLFSARSSLSGRVLEPRVLCANNMLLAKSSTYFLDLLSSDVNPSDPSLVDLADDHDVPSHVQIDDYGYGSDSDLDDSNDPVPVATSKAPKDRSAPKDDDDDKLSDDGSESSDMFVMSPEQPREEEPFAADKNRAGSAASSETAVQKPVGDNLKGVGNQTAMRLRSLASRHVLVKDTAFQTWYTLLNYLYTDKFSFLPLSSATPGGQSHESSTNYLDEPRCSAKSMYRLACKVGLDHLRDEAFSYIQSNLTDHNILQELSCSLVSTHPELLEMELDVLYAHVASPSVVANFPAFARRIANKELTHGADVVVGIHTRLLKGRASPLPWARTAPTGPASQVQVQGQAEAEDDERAGETRPAADEPLAAAVTPGRGVTSPNSSPMGPNNENEPIAKPPPTVIIAPEAAETLKFKAGGATRGTPNFMFGRPVSDNAKAPPAPRRKDY